MKIQPLVARDMPRARRGMIHRRGLLILVGCVLLIGLVGFTFRSKTAKSAGESAPIMHKVERSDFIHDITERGELESAENLEIRCEVKSQGSSGTSILEIVPEGTVVQAGDILVKLDASWLENDRTRQQIAVANSEAEVIKARTAYETAQVALKEYMEGTFRQSLELAQSEIYQMEENLRRAKEYVAYSEVLANKGYITESQLKADCFAAQKAEKDLDAAKMKRDVLTNFTRERMKKQLEADIEATEARLKAQLHSNELELGKLADIESQLERCTIRAPSAGQVVYANVGSLYGQAIIIEPGTMVRERQEIIHLPDHTKMQVKAKINEGKVSLVVPGMSAVVRLDAFPEIELEGVVERVNEYPVPTNRYTSSIKEYETTIRLINPPKGARPGLTAEVKIHVGHEANAIQVPVQAIFEHGDKQYAVLPDDDTDSGVRAVEVKLGPSNDKTVVVRGGLEEKQEIMLNAGYYRSKVDLPELPVEKPAPAAIAKRTILPKVKPTRLTDDRVARPERIALSNPNEASTIARLMQQFGKDGRVEVSALPDPLRAQLGPADVNHDQKLDHEELLAILAKINGRRHTTTAQSQPKGGAGP
jgi:multidrug resistance efflux pump